MKRKRIVTTRDFEILMFLWKWKILSTQAIAAKFFPESHPFAAYKRLVKLENQKLIRAVRFASGKGSGWVLEAKGYQEVFPYLPELLQGGCKIENHIHDFFATAFHLGELLCAKTDGVICTEQTLRRVQPELWPAWVPQSKSHRPDGYTLVRVGIHNYIYAFETELTQKTKSRYEKTLDFYEDETSINVVVWLVVSEHMQRLIENILKANAYSRLQIHNFIYLQDFKKLGWFASIHGGNLNGKKLIDYIRYDDGTKPVQNCSGSNCEALLKNEKRPSLPSDCKFPVATKSLD